MPVDTRIIDKAREVFGTLEDQVRGHNRLLQAVARKQYVLYLGAGIAGAMGYPGWEDLVQGVRQEVGRTIRLGTIHPLEQAQVVWSHYLSNVYKARPITDTTQRSQAELEFNRIVVNTLEKLRKPQERPEWFGLLRKHLPRDIVTTNWDKVIENELLDDLVNCFCFQAGMPVINQRLPNLYKIHGDVDDPRYLVFTEDQYYSWEQDDPYLVAKLRVLFSENLTLCLGYSFRDPNVQHQHFRVFLRFQGAVEPVYLLIDPTRHPADEWGLLQEQREYFGSRNVTLLFGLTPELLSLLDEKVTDYAESAGYRIQSIEPILKDLEHWRSQLERTVTSQHSLRMPKRASSERLSMITKGLVQIGLFPEIRQAVGLDVSEGLPHEVGVALLEDLEYLLQRPDVNESLEQQDYDDLALLLDRFSTKDSGAWRFAQQRKRLNLVLDFLPLLPESTLPRLASVLAEHVLFAGPTYGDCWGSWNDLNLRLAEIPNVLLRPLLDELIPAETWVDRKNKVQDFLQDEKAVTRLGIRLRLLQKHPAWEEIVGPRIVSLT